jgi:hypothetical protein
MIILKEFNTKILDIRFINVILMSSFSDWIEWTHNYDTMIPTLWTSRLLVVRKQERFSLQLDPYQKSFSKRPTTSCHANSRIRSNIKSIIPLYSTKIFAYT